MNRFVFALVALLILLLCVFGLYRFNQVMKVSQQEKDVLVESYIRLAYIMQDFSLRLCEEINENNNPDINSNCRGIEDIIVNIKSTPILTKSESLKHQKNLQLIVEQIVEISNEEKNKQLQSQMTAFEEQTEKELATLKNRNRKLMTENNRLQSRQSELIAEKQQALNAKYHADDRLRSIAYERDRALSEKLKLEQQVRNNAGAAQRLASVERELINLKTERDKILAELEKSKMNRLANNIEIDNENTTKQEQNSSKETDKNSFDSRYKTEIKNVDVKENLTAVQNEQMKKSEDQADNDEQSELKRKLADDLMLLSPNNRNRNLKNRIKSYFPKTKKEIISVNGKTYRVENYIKKLTFAGPFDILIKEIVTDKNGKVTNLELQEIRLIR